MRPLSVFPTPITEQQMKSPCSSAAQVIAAAVQSMIDEAIIFHRAGRYREAAQIYGQILKIDPHHADSLHLLGMVASQAGMVDLALNLIGKAIEIDGKVAAYHSNLGSILQGQGKLNEAAVQYAQALALNPRMAEIHLNLGLVLQTQGKLAEAVAEYLQAVELNPDLAEAHSNLGNGLHEQFKYDEAVTHYERALALKPDFPEACYNLGNALQAQEKLPEAAAQYERALALRPTLAEAHGNLGNVFQAMGDFDEAQAHYERAIEMRPNYAEAYYNLGNQLSSQKKLEEAVRQYQCALHYDPQCAKARNNLGNVYRSLEKPAEAVAQYEQVPDGDAEFTDAYNNLGLALLSLGRHEEAIRSIRRTLVLKPHLGQAYCNLCAVFHAQNRIAEATENYERALSLNPELAKARLNLGLVQLLSGNFAAGWKNYELRWEDAPLQHRPFTEPQWRGEPLNGERILLHAEQGYGDTLQFIRYVPLVQAAGGTVMLEVQSRLRRIAAELPGVTEVVCTGDALPAFDWHCPLLSLPQAFHTEMETIPAQTPYLFIPEEAQRKAETLDWPSEGLRVGLVWAGNPTFAQDRYRFRSAPLPLFRPIFEFPGVHLFSLQVGESTAQLAEAPGEIVDLSPNTTDMADTAGLIAHLDLVISVDTSVAHLAAGLGVPTWVLMPYSPDWRWLQEREDTPWYPAMRLFRQQQPGDWESVIQRMRDALATIRATPSHSHQKTSHFSTC